MATATAKRGAAKGSKEPKPAPKKRQRKKTAKNKAPEAQKDLLLTVKAENPNITSDEFAVRFNLPVDEVARHRAFCLQYLIDYNVKAAALRLGYPEESAWETGYRMLHYGFSQLFISECQRAATAETVVSVGQLMAKAWEECNKPDTVKDGCAMVNSTSRLGWANLLAKMMGAATPKPKQETPTLRRVMHVGPTGTTLAEWGDSARDSQRKLKASTVVDV
jgi:hypothetical protein